MIVAAKYLGVKPWELAEVASTWTDYALIALAVENETSGGPSEQGQP